MGDIVFQMSEDSGKGSYWAYDGIAVLGELNNTRGGLAMPEVRDSGSQKDWKT